MTSPNTPCRIAINGFGRIGRLALRAAPADVEVVAVNDLADPESLAYLFRNDSVHGRLHEPVGLKDGRLEWQGRSIPFFNRRDPRELPWGALGVDVVIEATGALRGRADGGRHLEAGAKHVLLTAPGDDVDRTIVMGVNEHELDLANDRFVSNASCTTNCIAPVAKVLHAAFGIESLVFTTIHAYTSSQTLVDTPMRKLRRGRAGALSMVPTSTGASKALGQVLPALAGRSAGMAVRVPVPDGSLTDMVVRFSRPPADVTGLLEPLRRAAATPALARILEVSDEELVSHDVVGDEHSAVVDATTVMRCSADTFKLLVWYDNEWGYANRVIDLARRLCGRE